MSRLIFSFFLFSFVAVVSSAEPIGVNWKLAQETVTASRGKIVHLQLVGEIPAGWHTYSSKEYKLGPQPTKVAVSSGAVELAGRLTSNPEPISAHDDGFNVDVETLTGTVTFDVPLKVKDMIAAGRHTIVLTVTSALCNERVCIGPSDAILSFILIVPQTSRLPLANKPPHLSEQAGETPAVRENNRSSTGSKLASETSASISLATYLWSSLVAGVFALLTPCVFPMIPITVSFFIKRQHISRQRAIRDAGIYSLIIILMFAGIGFFFALLLGATGITDFATNPWVNLLVAAVFILLALSLLGMYEIQLPEGLISKLTQSAQPGKGIVSVLLMGLIFTLTSFTCTTPFVGAIMVSATQGDWLWPLFGMLVFATVFSSPFFLLALFPAALKSLPKSGDWLNSVKALMGLLEIAAAMKFISNADLVWRWGLLTREVFLLTWIGLAVLAAFYLLNYIRVASDRSVTRRRGERGEELNYISVANDRPVTRRRGERGEELNYISVANDRSVTRRRGERGEELNYSVANDRPIDRLNGLRLALATSCFLIAIFLFSGLFGWSLGIVDAYVPPKVYPGDKNTSTELTWLDDWNVAVVEAHRLRRPIFANYTGHTCTNCRRMETGMFLRPEISERLRDYVRVRLHTDGRKDAAEIEQSNRNQRMQQERYRTTALPFYAIVSPDGVDLATFPGYTEDAESFQRFLDSGRK
ncbi:MAG: cytochrome c biogenesis protein CcdA [Planctomycetota bacterium]